MIDNKKNINWINAVKAICIIAVFLVHCQSYYGFTIGLANNFIHPFYVNAFFFVSGYLLFRKQLTEPLINQQVGGYAAGAGKRLILNLFWRIIIPSIIFAFATYLPKMLLKGGDANVSDFLWDTIGGGTYWFTSALIIAQLLVALMLLTRCQNIWFYAAISFLLMLLGIYMAGEQIVPFGFSRDLWMSRWGLLALPFLAAGGIYWRYEKQIQRIMKWYVLLVLIVVYATVFSFYLNDVRVLISMLDLNVLGLMGGCLGSIILIELCKLLPKIEVLTFIGQYSLGFYFMSGAVPVVMSMVVNKLLSPHTWYGLAIVFAGSLAISGVATYLLNKYTPWLFDLRVIKRTSR